MYGTQIDGVSDGTLMLMVDSSDNSTAGDSCSAELELCQRAVQGDSASLGHLLDRYAPRLTRMIRLRLSPALRRRVDESDILQETFADASTRITEFQPDPERPIYLWLRSIACARLAEAYRRHLGAQKRDVTRDVSIYRDGVPEASTASLALQLVGSLTSPSQAAIRAEQQSMVRLAIDAMDPTDREVLVLRHYEEMTLAEAASVLGISRVGAGKRYLRALDKLREITDRVGEMSGIV